MTTLHLIRDSALNNNSIALAISNIASNDAIVLIDDGCYNISQKFIHDIQARLPLNQCYAIEPHVLARALPKATVTLITYKDLLELIFNHQNVITWQ